MNAARLFGPGVQRLSSAETGIPFDAIAARGLVFTCWTPSPEELDAIKSGDPVWLIQRGPFIPDMSMRVGRQEAIIPHAVVSSPPALAVAGAVAAELAGPPVKPIDRLLFRAAVVVAAVLVIWIIAAVVS